VSDPDAPPLDPDALIGALERHKVDKDKLHEALDQAVIVIDADAFERSQKDPRVKDLFKGGQAPGKALPLRR
jgi:hypothetical protein